MGSVGKVRDYVVFGFFPTLFDAVLIETNEFIIFMGNSARGPCEYFSYALLHTVNCTDFL